MHVRCPMCGSEFDPSDIRCHAGCPLGDRCALICCPQCGYQMPDLARSTSARWFQQLFARLRPSPPRDHVSLGEVPPGQTVVVADIREAAGDRLAQLVHLGVVPGAVVRVLRRRPVLIVEIDGAAFALDPDIARSIRVEAL